MSPKAKRLSIIAVIAALVGIAAMLVLGALRDNIVFFYTPTEITTSGTKVGQALRLRQAAAAASRRPRQQALWYRVWRRAQRPRRPQRVARAQAQLKAPLRRRPRAPS